MLVLQDWGFEDPPLPLSAVAAAVALSYCEWTGRVVHTSQDKLTPLFIAAKGRKVGAVRALIEAGAEVDAECGVGMVRLHIFISHTDKGRLFLRWSAFGARCELRMCTLKVCEVGSWRLNTTIRRIFLRVTTVQPYG